MAVATLERCYNNPSVFTGVVKIRRGEAVRLMSMATNLESVKAIFSYFVSKVSGHSDFHYHIPYLWAIISVKNYGRNWEKRRTNNIRLDLAITLSDMHQITTEFLITSQLPGLILRRFIENDYCTTNSYFINSIQTALCLIWNVIIM